jgi:NADPH:quinone reductase-like Zn-dependent oxidoreductase
MRAIVFERNGGPEVLGPKDLPDPAPGEGQVVVDVEAIGVNYRDVYERNGGDGSKAPGTCSTPRRRSLKRANGSASPLAKPKPSRLRGRR